MPFIASIIVLWLAFCPCQAKAMQSEPEGYSGVKLGADIGSLSGLECYTDSEEAKICVREGQSLDFEGGKLRAVTYTFLNGKLYMIELTADGQEGFERFKSYAASRHGKPSAEVATQIMYEGKRVDVLIEFDKKNNISSLSFASRFLYGCVPE